MTIKWHNPVFGDCVMQNCLSCQHFGEICCLQLQGISKSLLGKWCEVHSGKIHVMAIWKPWFTITILICNHIYCSIYIQVNIISNPTTNKVHLHGFVHSYMQASLTLEHSIHSPSCTSYHIKWKWPVIVTADQYNTKLTMGINLVDNMLLLPMFLTKDCNFTPQNFIFSFHGTKLWV
jgi:hypothetical protein